MRLVLLSQVGSFGVGAHVKLPGATQKEPNVFQFGTPYKEIFQNLSSKDPDLYTRNGMLRNCQVSWFEDFEVTFTASVFTICLSR